MADEESPKRERRRKRRQKRRIRRRNIMGYDRDFRRVLRKTARIVAKGDRLRSKMNMAFDKFDVDRKDFDRFMTDPSAYQSEEVWKVIQETVNFWESQFSQAKKETVKATKKKQEAKKSVKKKKRLKGKGVGDRRGWLKM